MKCLDVVKEVEVGAREDEVFGCGGGHAGGRSKEG